MWRIGAQALSDKQQVKVGLPPASDSASQHRERAEADRERPEHRGESLDFDH